MNASRMFDAAAAAAALVVLAPALAAIALLVRLSSPGPALFRQSRVGAGGRDFTLYKFRSMTTREGTQAGSFDAGDTSRVTRLGRLLRASKLDELPQLWNVLRGDMALVGPRPEVRAWVAAYPERWAPIHGVRPGITDPASILYRHEERILADADDPERTYRDVILPRKLDLYDQYIRTRSFRKDLAILWRTLRAVASRDPNPGPRAHDDDNDRGPADREPAEAHPLLTR